MKPLLTANLEEFLATFLLFTEKILPDIRSGIDKFSVGPNRFLSVMSVGPTGFGFHCNQKNVLMQHAETKCNVETNRICVLQLIQLVYGRVTITLRVPIFLIRITIYLKKKIVIV